MLDRSVKTFPPHKGSSRQEKPTNLSLVVELINWFASLFPGDSLLPLPHCVHITVVHTLAPQVFLQLQWAGLVGVAGPPVLLSSSLTTSVTTITSIPPTAANIPAFSHTSKLVSSLRLLEWNLIRNTNSHQSPLPRVTGQGTTGQIRKKIKRMSTYLHIIINWTRLAGGICWNPGISRFCRMEIFSRSLLVSGDSSRSWNERKYQNRKKHSLKFTYLILWMNVLEFWWYLFINLIYFEIFAFLFLRKIIMVTLFQITKPFW